MSDQQCDEIVLAAKQKFAFSGGNFLFHCGLIALGSLIAGLGFLQVADMPSGLSVEDEKFFRLGLGVLLSGVLALIGSVAYAILIWRRGMRMKRETNEMIVAAALRDIERK